ncbi:glycosyltransferase family 2 protein [Pseudoalteromonas tetraodonis]|uniref:glycosyltransferase family 2 protein n=1 Tax=Pseudoalteromonas tetraodonis TaxID=43659 RepID=UPI003CFE5625
MDKSIKVSIITATFNSENEITDTYTSIKGQTFTNWEWIVTDDCSSDGTYEVLTELERMDTRIKVFKNSVNCGAAVSRNNSLSHVRGDLIAFIDSDDIWLPTKLEKQIEFMERGVDFSFTAYDLINNKGKSLNQTVDTKQTGCFTYEDMLKKKATLGCSTVMLRKDSFIDITMPLLRTGQDYAMWLKLLKTGKSAYLLNEVLTRYRIMPNSISRNKIKKAKRQWQIYREIENISFSKSVVCFCFYAWRAIFRK